MKLAMRSTKLFYHTFLFSTCQSKTMKELTLVNLILETLDYNDVWLTKMLLLFWNNRWQRLQTQLTLCLRIDVFVKWIKLVSIISIVSNANDVILWSVSQQKQNKRAFPIKTKCKPDRMASRTKAQIQIPMYLCIMYLCTRVKDFFWGF